MKSVQKSRTAAFDVDPQKGFSPLCPNELPVPDGDGIVDALNAQAALASVRVASKDCHPDVAPWITTDPVQICTPVEGDYPNLDVKWPPHCVVGTEGNDLLPGLPEEGEYDFVVNKGMDPEKHPYGACYHDLADTESTGVIEFLKGRGIETVIVGGLATEYCVKTTAIQLANGGFRVVLNLAACRGLGENEIVGAIREMEALGIEVVADVHRVEAA